MLGSTAPSRARVATSSARHAKYRRARRLAVLAAATAAAAPLPALAGLVNRYSFSDGGIDGTTVADSVGTANGLLVDRSRTGTGTNAATFGGGQLLFGNPGTSGDVATGNYVDLPNNIARTPNVTIEGWATWSGGNDWQRIFDFGTTNQGERLPDNTAGGYGGASYFFVSPKVGRNGGFGSEVRLANGAGANADQPGVDFGTGAEHHFALTIRGGAGGAITLYKDGRQVATNTTDVDPSTIDQVNTWIGRSNFVDTFFGGSINEFRVHDTAQTANQVAASFGAGPDALPGVPTTRFWNVAGPADYTAAANWSPTGVPVAGDTAVFANGGQATVSADVTAPVILQMQNGRIAVAAGATYGVAGADIAPGSTAGNAVAFDVGGTLALPGVTVDGAVTSGGTAAKTINFTAGGAVLRASGSLDAPNVTLGLGTAGGTIDTPADFTLRAAVTGTGTLTKTGGGRLTFVYPSGNTTDLTSGGRSLTVDNGDLSVRIPDAGQNVTWAGDVGGTAGRLIKQGPGTLTLGGAQTRTNIWLAQGAVVLDGAAANLTGTQFLAIGLNPGDDATMVVRNGAALTVTNDLNAGDNGSRGSLIVEGATSTVTFNQLGVGKFGNASGAVRQVDGTVQRGPAGGDSRIGGQGGTGDNNAVGVYDMRGGTFSTPANLQVGAFGRGQMNVTGGTVNLTGGFPAIGRFTTGVGELIVTGGAVNQTNPGSRLLVAEQGLGTLTVGGTGAVTIGTTQAQGLQLGAATEGTGAVTLGTGTAGGGTITAPRVSKGGGTGRFTFNGGRLVASADSANFMQDLNSAVVQAAGGTIDTNGRTVTIAQSLLAPIGGRVATIPVTSGGSGYVAAPIVNVSGGGTGATGLANLDPATGAVTSITVTNPGTDYGAAPTVTLIGGNPATAAVPGTPTTAAPASGGINKVGAGTLTLAGTNTYTGTTTVSAGTLLVTGSLAGVASVGGGGNLGGSGSIAGPVAVASGGSLAPGNSPGMLTVGGVTLVPGGTLAVELNGTTPGAEHDQLVVNAGTVTLGGGTLAVATGYTPTVGDQYVIIDNQAASPVGGTFAQGGLVTANGTPFTINYAGGDGNDVVLTAVAVPEPAAAGLVGLAAVGLLARRRRRGYNCG